MQEEAVHAGGPSEGEGDGACRLAVWRCPIGVPLAVVQLLGSKTLAAFAAGCGLRLAEKVCLQFCVDNLAKAYGVGAVDSIHASFPVDREVE